MAWWISRVPWAGLRSQLTGRYGQGTWAMPGQADVQLQAMEVGPVRPDPDAMRAELKALLASWEYAFAMGH